MNYGSFYGGRRGPAFIIVQSYLTVAAMIAEFQKGGSYEIVNYDEYVIIDTENKNDADNGKVFRRGYDYSNDMGGAIYVGQIIGPSGPAPHLEFKTISEVENIYNEYKENNPLLNIRPQDDFTIEEYAPTENLVPGQYFDENGEEQFNDTIKWAYCSIRSDDNSDTTAHIGFKIPYLVNLYTSESVSPYYHRSDMEPTDVTPDQKWDKWDEKTDVPGSTAAENVEKNKFENKELIKRVDDFAHPFFERWNIKIPKGIKGDTFKRLRVTTVEECIKNGTTIIGEDNQPIVLRNYEGYTDDNLDGKSEFDHSYKKRKILVYDYYNYNRVAGGDPVALYLGDYNMIDDFRIDDDGTIRIVYSHDDTNYYANYLKAVDTVQLNPETGLLQVDYNFDQQYERDENGDFKLDSGGNKIPIPNTETHYETYLHWVKDIHFDDEGTIVWEFTTPEDDRSDNQKVKWMTAMKLNPVNGQLDIDFNYDQKYEVNQGEDITKNGIYKLDSEGNRIPIPDTETHIHENLQWVKDIKYDQDGTLTWSYTWKDNILEKQETLPNFLKWIEGVKLNPNTGKFEIDFNYETEPDGAIDYQGNDISGQPTHYETSLTWVKDIIMNKYGTINFVYTDQSDTIYKNHIKWINDVSLDTDTGLFTVNFNYDKTRDGEVNAKEDTQYTTYLRYVKNVRIDDDGTIHFDYSHGNEQLFDRYLKTVKSITLNPENGKFAIDYNQVRDKDNNLTHYEQDLKWVKDVEVAENGTITFIYTVGDNKVIPNYLKNISSITLNPDTGLFEINYNYGGEDTKYSQNLKWVKDISINDEGTVIFDYTTGDDKINEKQFKWIKSISLDKTNGHFTILYNHENDKDGNPTKYETDLDWIKGIEVAEDGTIILKHSSDPDTVLDNKIKWIKDTEINIGDTEGSGNQKIKITYNDDTTKDIGNPLNYIMKTDITDDYHLVVLHADPTKRAGIIAAGKNYEWDGRSDWQDLGSVKDDDGILIGLNLDTSTNSQLDTIATTINYLNNEYPIGLVEPDMYGKIISVGGVENNKKLYAFDYSKINGAYKGWYFLGTTSESSTIVGLEGDSDIQTLASKLPVNGMWFILDGE